MAQTQANTNPLGQEPVGALLRRFAVPSIIAMLVSSLYNIVDQFFIGRSIGELGNAATNITFPFSTACIAIALLCGIGGAAAFNIAMGAKQEKKAGYYVGGAVTLMLIAGIVLAALCLIFLRPLLSFMGAPAEVMPYALTYARVIAFGFPALIISAGGGHLVRADGSPTFTMIINLTGAIVNTILDALFVFGFRWGMFGAALATIIGQYVAMFLVFWYLRRFKTKRLEAKHFYLRASSVTRFAALGMSPCITQLSIIVFQIVMNRSLRYYGGLSEYGESIPIACVGIITKVMQVAFAFIIGISQGMQPIASFNRGAERYDRVKQVYLKATLAAAVIAFSSYALVQLIPRRILSIFGEGSESYFKFGVRYFRVYMLMFWTCFLQPVAASFFSAIGKPRKGIFLSLTRQILFLVPLILILPRFFGIDGIMYAGPIADTVAMIASFLMVFFEFRDPCYKTTKTA